MIWVRTFRPYARALQAADLFREIVHIGLILIPVSGSTYKRIGLFILPGYGIHGLNIFSKHQVARTITIE
jgi:hypothetical protein